MAEAPDRQIHVMHVVPTFGRGGMELALARVIRGLAGRGIRHTVICLKAEAPLRDEVGSLADVHCLAARPRELFLFLRLRRLIRSVRPTVLHVRNWSAYVDVALARVALRPRVPLVFSFHGVDRVGRWPLRRRLAFRRLARTTDRVFTVSGASRAWLVEHTGLDAERIGVISNGIDTDVFSPPGHPRAPSPRLVVGTVGGQKAVKNQALLVRAVAALLADGLDVELRLAGRGPEHEALEQLAASLGCGQRVRFAGLVADVPAFLRELDIFVLPSDSEQHPNALLEAMACGVPSVATRVGGVPDVLDDGRFGLLVDAGDLDGLAAAIRRLATDAGLRGELAAAGRQRVCERYGLPAMLAAYEGLYRDLSR